MSNVKKLTWSVGPFHFEQVGNKITCNFTGPETIFTLNMPEDASETQSKTWANKQLLDKLDVWLAEAVRFHPEINP